MNALDALKRVFSDKPDLAFAVLVGSRADGTAQANSDWDIAVQWQMSVDWLTVIGAHESLRREIAQLLGASDLQVDLIDLDRASLVMRANVAENGKVLIGEDSLNWMHFLSRSWRKLEYFYWEQAHAA